ncbi:hypothetical protein KR054_006890 [Drosophila jambulina]|nr:hypothetical protein KR054_006890 [Drosophila jambulina]
MALNTQQLQQPQQQRVPAMSSMHGKPLTGHGIPIEHPQRLQQSQYLQQQYYYGGQTQPVMRVWYNPESWYPQQDQLHQQYHLPSQQYWYNMPYINIPHGIHLKSATPGRISPPLNQHSNGAQKQGTTKSRSRPAQSSAIQGRHIAGGRSCFPQKTLADCCLNRIRSISSIQNSKGSPIQGSEQCKDNDQLKAALSQESAKPQEEIKKKENEQEQGNEFVKEEIYTEKEEESSLGNGTNSLFRRLAHFMRFKTARKAKNKKNTNGSNDVFTQPSSFCSSAKKHGFFSRLFGGFDSSNQAQSALERHTQNLTNMQIKNIDLDEVCEVESFKKLRSGI